MNFAVFEFVNSMCVYRLTFLYNYFIMEWNKDNIIQFIEVYKNFDIIWDPKHMHHYNKFKKQGAWDEISNEVGKSVEECKKKMDYLLANLRREKMKMNKRTGTGKEAKEDYKSPWFALDSMRFLWNKNKHRSSLSTLPKATSSKVEPPIEGTEDDVSLGELSDETSEVNQAMSASTKHHIHHTPAGSSSKRRQHPSEEQRPDNASQNLQSTSTAGTTDDSYHFGNLVASKMRNYEENIRCKIQQDILDIFIRASDGYYNKVTVLRSDIIENSLSSNSGSSIFPDIHDIKCEYMD